MLSCYGLCCSARANNDYDDETRPLLTDYQDETSLQCSVHRKLHTYQMLHALSNGYMPSNEQIAIHLHMMLGSAALNPRSEVLSPAGRRFFELARRWVSQSIELLLNKNDGDVMQEIVWHASRGRVEVDTGEISSAASRLRPKADVSAVYEGFKIIANLALGNRDFRLLLTDLNIVAREILSDTAAAAAEASRNTAEQVAPAESEVDALKHPGEESRTVGLDSGSSLSGPQIADDIQDKLAEVAVRAGYSLSEHFSGAERSTLILRLKQAVERLRERSHYGHSVSTLGSIVRGYMQLYSRAAQRSLQTVADDVRPNDELDYALKAMWAFVGRFGEARKWELLRGACDKVATHGATDAAIEQALDNVGAIFQKLFTDPNFFDTAEKQLDDVRQQLSTLGSDSASSLRHDLDDLVAKFKAASASALADIDIAGLRETTVNLTSLIYPPGNAFNPDIVQDGLNIFLPALINAVQYIPIPRLELSSHQMDLLLENLVLEPGATINQSSFMPFRVRVETHSEVAITKARFRTHSSARTKVFVSAEGLSLRAEEVGYWLRMHSGSGLFRVADEGIASFALDGRGIDIQLEIELMDDGRDDKHLLLRAVRVKVHRLDYRLRKSKLASLAWLIKPVLRPILRCIIERLIKRAIEQSLSAFEREVADARERMRGARAAAPGDLAAMLRALCARRTFEADTDVHAGFGVVGSAKGEGPSVFRGVYAPGSIVKMWDEEALRTMEHVDEAASGRWRNDIFNVPVAYT